MPIDVSVTDCPFDLNTEALLHGDGETYVSATKFEYFGTGPDLTLNSRLSSDHVKFFPTALRFDGGNFYRATGTPTWKMGSSDWTYECCACFDLAAGNEVLFSQYEDDNNRLYIYRWDRPSRLGIAWVVDGIGRAYECSVDFEALKWAHLAFVRSGGTLLFFVNGELVGRHSIVSVMKDYNGTSLIGSNMWAGNPEAGTRARGWMDEIRLSMVARWTAPFTPEDHPYGPVSSSSSSISSESFSSSSSCSSVEPSLSSSSSESLSSESSEFSSSSSESQSSSLSSSSSSSFSSSSSESLSSSSSSEEPSKVFTMDIRNAHSEAKSFSLTMWPKDFKVEATRVIKLGLFSLCPLSGSLLLLKVGDESVTVLSRRSGFVHGGGDKWQWFDINPCDLAEGTRVTVGLALYSGTTYTMDKGAPGCRVRSYMISGDIVASEEGYAPCVGLWVE